MAVETELLADMKFYPTNDLYTEYRKRTVHTWLSPRVEDHTNRRTLDLLNRAINCCDQWDTFLDVGAGSGRYSVTLLSKFKQGIAVEVSKDPDLLQVQREYPTLRVLHRPIQQVKLQEQVDFILLADVFEHIPPKDVPSFLRSIGRALRSGGVVYVLTPNQVQCGPAAESGIYYTRHKYGHYKQYTPVEIQHLFESIGLTVVFCRFEDAPLRRHIKLLMLAASVIDKKLLSIPGYRIVSFPFVYLLNTVFSLLGFLCTYNECVHEQDTTETRSQVWAFKKL